MNKIIRFYNQNRRKIFITIIIIAFLFALLQLLDKSLEIKNRYESDNMSKVENIENENILISGKSISTGEKISNLILQKDSEIIKKFIEYCNDKNLEEAYNLLTDECKEEMFPNINDFMNIYYMSFFNGETQYYTIENWSGNTYEINLVGDILSTGKVNDMKNKQDYITIVKQKNDNYKININNYIGRIMLNKQTESNNIIINIESKDVYKDYEIYNISISNNTNNIISLSMIEDSKAIYLLDENNMKYYFYNNEIIQNKLIIQKGFKNSLKIKFDNSYSSTKNIETLVFSKMILDYNEYKDLEDKTKYDFYVFKANI